MVAAAMSTAAWQRASLPMLILNVLSVGPRHGYGISQSLASAGLQPIKGAQLNNSIEKQAEIHRRKAKDKILSVSYFSNSISTVPAVPLPQ